jgi:hypothetical protein
MLLDVVVKSLMERSHHRGTTIVSESGPEAVTSIVTAAAAVVAAVAAVATFAVNKLVPPAAAVVDTCPVKSRLRGFHCARSAWFDTPALDLSGAINATPLLNIQQIKSST